MGVFDFVKEGTREMRVARGSDSAVSVHVDDSLPLYGELDVERDDCAVFIRDGRAIGILGPGRHTLHLSNIPFLAGGESDGRIPARVVFVRLTPIDGQPFSAPLEQVDDPLTHGAASGVLEGAMTVQIVDPAAFVEDHLRAPKRPLFARPGVSIAVEGMRIREGQHLARVLAANQMPRPSQPEEPPNEERGAPMDCRACGKHGEIGAFCEGCGTLLSARARCVACRAVLEPNARFCAGCGVRTEA